MICPECSQHGAVKCGSGYWCDTCGSIASWVELEPAEIDEADINLWSGFPNLTLQVPPLLTVAFLLGDAVISFKIERRKP